MNTNPPPNDRETAPPGTEPAATSPSGTHAWTVTVFGDRGPAPVCPDGCAPR